MSIENKTIGAEITLDPVLSEKQLRDWLGVSLPTLARWRESGGPAFIKMGPRRIGYRRSAVEKWLAASERDPDTTAA